MNIIEDGNNRVVIRCSWQFLDIFRGVDRKSKSFIIIPHAAFADTPICFMLLKHVETQILYDCIVNGCGMLWQYVAPFLNYTFVTDITAGWAAEAAFFLGRGWGCCCSKGWPMTSVVGRCGASGIDLSVAQLQRKSHDLIHLMRCLQMSLSSYH